METENSYTEDVRMAALALLMLKYSGGLNTSEVSDTETEATVDASAHSETSSVSSYEPNTENYSQRKRATRRKLFENRRILQTENVDEMVPIGSGRTLVPKTAYDKLNLKSYSKATRSLAVAVFGQEVLATHSLSGQKSPAFADRPAKEGLDPTKVHDVIIEIQKRFRVDKNFIRTVITTKCADENRLWRKKQAGKGNRNKLIAMSSY